jgi:hypothetical protein
MSPSPRRAELLRQVHGLLGASLDATALDANAANDLFEAYLWSAVTEAARDLLGPQRVWLEGVHGQRTSRVVLRTSPGLIWSTANPYTHMVLDFGAGQEVEAHVGIRVHGKSRVLHECDVVVLDRAEAQRCRNEQDSPRSSSVLLAAEAKFYTTPLKISLAREFIGFRADVNARSAWFVANTSRPNLARLLVHRTQANTLHADVTPHSLEHDDLVAHVRLVFRDYMAR